MSFARSVARSIALGCAFVVPAASCGGSEELTEIVVVVDSDIDFPNRADRIVVVADDGQGGVFERDRAIADPRGTLPLTLSVRAPKDKGTISLRAEARQGDTVVASRVMRAAFVPNASRTASLVLCDVCRDITCAEGETCTERGCGPVDASSLPEWTGSPPPRATCGGCRPDVGLAPLRVFDATAKKDVGHTCNIGDALVQDDKGAGLDYIPKVDDPSNPGATLGTIGGVTVAGCVAVDFGSPLAVDPVIVRARSVAKACGWGCRDTGCGTRHVVSVFTAVREDAWENAGTINLDATGTLFRDYALQTNKNARFVAVCRTANGYDADDMEVDVIRSGAACP